MKLHLPKRLFTALLSVLTLAAAPAALTLGSAAWGADFVDAPVNGGNLWADDYSFYFVYDGSNGQTVMFYRGSASNDDLGYNGISVTENNGALTLTIGQGKANNTTSINDSTTFAHNGNKLGYSIEAGVVYFMSVTADNSGNMTPTITAVSTSGSLSSQNGSTHYGGKMNGNSTSTIESALNQKYALDASSLLWSGAATGADLGTGSNWKTLGGNEVATLENGNLIFDASSNVAKTVNVTGTVSVGSIQLYDNYTFNTDTSATLNVTNGISIASGKTLAFNVEKDITTTHGGIITGTGALTKTGAGTLILAGNSTNWTGDIIVSGGILKAGTEQDKAYFGRRYEADKNRKITLKNGATLDVNGTESYYHVVMENGATITNTGDNVNTGWRALPWIELNGDATIDAPNRVVMQKGGNDNDGTFALDLNGHKLTKTGSDELYIKNITITSGTIQVDAGSLTLASDVTLEDGIQVNLEKNAVLNAVLNEGSSASGVTLTGSGTYNYGSYTTDNTFNPGLGADWTGTVVLKTGGAAIQLTHLAQASNQNSKLQLTGFRGYLDNTDHTMTNNLILKNGDDGYGILLDNGSSDYDANVSFTGSIEGDGHIVYGWKNTTDTGKAGKTATHTFSGDISKWSGMFIRDLSLSGTSGQSMGKNVVVKFTAGGNIFSADGKGGVKEAEDAVDAGKLSVVIDAAEDENGVTPLTNFRGSISGVREVEVKSDTTFQAAVDTGLLTVDAGVTATLNAAANVGTLSAASATIAVGQSTILTLGGGTETEQKEHTVGSITTAAGAGISLGDYATLTLSASLPNGYAGETGNTDAKSSLALNISGGQNTRLNLKLTTDTGWQHNNTVSLSALTEKGKTVDTVYIASGALANTVFGESDDTSYGTHATTNLGGAALSMADQTKLVLRKPKSTGDDFGAGKITLEGTTTLYLYGSVFTLNNDIEGKHLEVTNAGSIIFAGSLNLESLTTSRAITFGGGTAQTQKLHSIGTLSATSNNVTIGEYVTLTLGGDLSTSGNVTMSENATLTLGGGLSTSGNVTMSGNATLTLSGGTIEAKRVHSANQLTAGGSNANILVGDYAELTLNDYLDLSKGFASSGLMTVGVGSTVKATNNIWLNKDYSILLKDTAKLKFGDSVTMTGRQGDESLITTSAYKDADGQGHNRDMYSADRETYTLSHVNVEISAAGDTTMGNKLEASALTHAGSGTLTVSNSGNTITSLAAEGGHVKLSASMGVDSISAKTDKLVTVTNGNTISMAGGVSIGTNGADATLTAQTDTALLQLQEDASFSIKDMALSNVAISAANAENKVNLTNVTATNVQLAQGSFTMTDKIALDGAVGTYSVEGSTASFTTGQLNGITLNNASGAASLTVDLGELPDCLQDGKTYNITIALSGFHMAAYDGTGLLFAADSWLGKLLADQGASRYVSSGDVESATTLAANNNTVTVTYTAMTGNVGTIITITGLTIPEPTTSTLSLLALAGLAARRRRQH